MKGEYVEDKDHHHPNNMFSKLHQTQKFQNYPQQHHHHQHSLHLQHHNHHHFQVTTGRECQTSEEADSRSPVRATTTTQQPTTANGGDGETIEVVRRPRGRPPGSKNKPKPPVIITRDNEPSMSPYVLELPGGADIGAAVTRFCRKRNIGICVLSGSGTVANVTLKQPSTTPGATVTFHGRFDILSLSTTILPNTTSLGIPNLANGFTISLAGPQGQIVGGSVVGPLLAAGTVYIIAASFNSPLYHRLPGEDELRNSSISGGNNNEGGQSPPGTVVSGGGGDGGHPPSTAEESGCGMSIYSGHLQQTNDVIWAPTARQPPPPPY